MRNRWFLLCLSLFLGYFVFSCSGSSTTDNVEGPDRDIGEEGKTCTTEGTCNEGLKCVNELCIPDDTQNGGLSDDLRDEDEECSVEENILCKELLDCVDGICIPRQSNEAPPAANASIPASGNDIDTIINALCETIFGCYTLDIDVATCNRNLTKITNFTEIMDEFGFEEKDDYTVAIAKDLLDTGTYQKNSDVFDSCINTIRNFNCKNDAERLCNIPKDGYSCVEEFIDEICEGSFVKQENN